MFSTRMLAAVTVAAVCFVVCPAARAAFQEPTGWTRPADNTQAAADLTTYQEWSPTGSGTTPYHVATPGDAFNPNGDAVVSEATGLGSIVSSGNYYSDTVVIEPVVDVPSYNLGAGYVTRFLVQLYTEGNDITPELAIDGIDAATLDGFDYQRLSETSVTFDPDGPSGPAPEITSVNIEHAWSFTVVGSAASYEIAFDWQGLIHTSFGHLRVDTLTEVPTAAPTPAGAAAGAFGLVALAMRRRRRRSA